ncbi:hypothetical protein GGR54DRAFT_588049, partial [Hypoxylon sp. NC1633]
MALSLAISAARRTAGLPPAVVKNQPFSQEAANLEESEWSSGASNDEVVNMAPTSSLDEDILEFLIPSFDVQESVDSWSHPFPAGSSEMPGPSFGPDMFDGGIDMATPNLIPAVGGYPNFVGSSATPFEPDRAIHLARPPEDIVPYIGAGAYTLAGQMYWTAMAFGFQAIRAILTSSSPPPAAVNIVAALFRHTLKRVALTEIMFLMHARLAFRNPKLDLEPLREKRWALDSKVPVELSTSMTNELQKVGLRKDDYLTPLDVERRLRDRFRDEYPIFEAALRGQALAEEHVACMRKLMQIMSRQSMCFGDGPRWKPESVDTIVEGWKMSTNQTAV